MAHKDWKKYADNEWTKKDNKYSFAKIWKIGLSSKERIRRGIGAYAFAGRVNREGYETKTYFKSKPQANKYAKLYMRKH